MHLNLAVFLQQWFYGHGPRVTLPRFYKLLCYKAILDNIDLKELQDELETLKCKKNYPFSCDGSKLVYEAFA